MADKVILGGDVGGTKTHLALWRVAGAGLQRLTDKIYHTPEFPSLEAICADFLGGAKPPDALCFGVPGPVIDGRSHPTNLAWTVEERALAANFSGAPVSLMNDLEVTAYGVLHLTGQETAVLQPGERTGGANVAVIAAGTGLGEAALIEERGRYLAIATEGGHCDFAPRGDEQIELMKFLVAEFGHASYERVLSGPGLVNIYRFLKISSPGPEPAWLRSEFEQADDQAAVVSQAALEQRDPRCVRALDLFVAIYGSEAANLALKMLALGGVYLGGGIAPKILPLLQQGGFVRAFDDKGRLGEVLRRIEVRVVMNQEAALLGAAYCALELLNRSTTVLNHHNSRET
jgi:glucokinase